MPYVITERCIDVCDTACVSACPVDCIDGPPEPEREQLFIDPDACICCAACVSVCPVEAIFDEDDVPAASHASIERNARFFQLRRSA